MPDTVADLSGAWLAHPARENLHQRYFERGFDDGDWIKAAVPGHWRSLPELAANDDPVLYRLAFAAERPAAGRRRFLEFEGVFYDGDVWFDEQYAGATTGYFLPHAFEVTRACREAEEHVVAVEVACPPQTDAGAKRLITGVFSHWDCLDSTWNPGGIWRPVRLLETGPVRIARLNVACLTATEERGRLRLALTLDAAPGGSGPLGAHLRARVAGAGVDLEAQRDEALAAGENRLEWVLDVDRPPRWWPRRLGAQPLVDVEVSVEVGGEVSDTTVRRTGFREVRLHDWQLSVNGERMFVMGANHAPTRQELGDATAEELAHDVELAVAANLDMLRVHAHVTRPEFYAAADEAGLLVWQDFPLQWGYARSIRKQAVRQAGAMVDLVGHHPSVVLWCGHNEPLAVDVPTGTEPTPGLVAKIGASMTLPTWNKTVLDRSVARAIQKADGTRPVNRHSGVLPGPAHGGTDSHLYFGWYYGEMGHLSRALKAWPRLARFVSEYGAQAVPDDAPYLEAQAEAWPDLDWDGLLERHCVQKVWMDHYVPPADFPDLDAWRAATQAYQAALLQLQTEDLRRLKYSPCGGFLQFCFSDALPSVTWSVLDHERRPKPGFAALRDACRPVLPMVDPRKGDLHVVSELAHRLAGAVVIVEAGGETLEWSGDVAADAVTYVGTVAAATASALGAEDAITVTLRHPDVGEVVNTYPPALLAHLR